VTPKTELFTTTRQKQITRNHEKNTGTTKTATKFANDTCMWRSIKIY